MLIKIIDKIKNISGSTTYWKCTAIVENGDQKQGQTWFEPELEKEIDVIEEAGKYGVVWKRPSDAAQKNSNSSSYNRQTALKCAVDAISKTEKEFTSDSIIALARKFEQYLNNG